MHLKRLVLLPLATVFVALPALAGAQNGPIRIVYPHYDQMNPPQAGVPYTNTPSVSGAPAGAKFVIAPYSTARGGSDQLPAGLTLDPRTGTISGTPPKPVPFTQVWITVEGQTIDEGLFSITFQPNANVCGVTIGPDGTLQLVGNGDGFFAAMRAVTPRAAQKCASKPHITAARVGHKLRLKIGEAPAGVSVVVRGAPTANLIKSARGRTLLKTPESSKEFPATTKLVSAPASIKVVEAIWSKKGAKSLFGPPAFVKR